MDNIKTYIQSRQSLLQILLSAVAVIIVIVQSLIYIKRLEVNLDEGAYLLKGYYFIKGIYKPYQQYGFWMDQMPLAYLIPGWVQQIFGLGLNVGRYFMVFLLSLTLIGLWIIVSRYPGKWNVAFVLWAIALNPVLIKMYSTVVTQGIAAFLLTWVLVFGIKKNISIWNLLIATLLATALSLVRLNLLPVPLLFMAYIFIKYGWRHGIINLLLFVSLFIYVHIMYWPGILQIYARWIPNGFFPILDLWRVNQKLLYWHPNYDIQSRIISLFRAFRFHYLLLLGSLASFLGLYKFSFRKNKHVIIDYFFVLSLFWLLLILHSIVTLGGDHCNFCLESYIAFFAPLGYVLIVISYQIWEKHIPRGINIIIIIFILLIINSGIGLLNTDNFNKGILYLHSPTISSYFPFINFNGLLLYKYVKRRFTLLTIHQIQLIDITLTNFIINLVLLILIFIIIKFNLFQIFIDFYKKIIDKNNSKTYNNKYSYSILLLIIIFAFAFLLSPTRILSGGQYGYECNSNTLNSYINVGKELANIIPAGSKVYWHSIDPLPLLYVNNIIIFPPQVNDAYTLYSDGNDDYLLKLGYWNESIANRWINDSDIIVVEEKYYNNLQYSAHLQNKKYKLVITSPQTPCRFDSRLFVFIK